MKISLDTKRAIKNDRETLGMSYGKLSLKYLVSLTKVYYICNPEKEVVDVLKRPVKSPEANIKHCAKYRRKKQAERAQKESK